MQVGIMGLPLAGKTTIFNALTGSGTATAAFGSGQCQVQSAIVAVPDPRVGRLSAMFKPEKTTYARIQFNDVSGLVGGRNESKASLEPQLLNALGQSDALLQVVRAFQSDHVPHPDGDVDPSRDLENLRFELTFSDLAVVEARIERIENGLCKHRGKDGDALKSELALMQRLREALEAGTPLCDLDLTSAEEAALRGYQFLSQKPTVVAVNLDEQADPGDLDWANHRSRSSALALRGAIEMEIAQLAEDEVALFLESYGIAEPTLHALMRECYRLLGLMSFFTVGEDEVRAWTVRRGAPAVEAAGAIHSDLARGFIRAEVVSYDDLVTLGGLPEARRAGRLRLEGKDYVVQDGDVLNIRFNV